VLGRELRRLRRLGPQLREPRRHRRRNLRCRRAKIGQIEGSRSG
jgi:hypothetical protein